MLRLLLASVAFVASGCFIDAEGLPPPVGGDATAGGGQPGVGGSAGEAPSNGGGGSTASAGGMGGIGEGGAPVGQHCPPGEVATDISEGVLECAPIGAPITKAIADNCAVFYGWRDNCDAGCTMAPDRVGRVTSAGCSENVNGDSSCQDVDLGGDVGVPLFGFDLDGDPNGNDRFYSAIHCAAGAADGAPCDGAGGFVTAYTNGTATCTGISSAVLEYVRPRCELVRGWTDQCTGGCTAITKRLSSSTLACDAGNGGYCADVTLGSDMVKLASFDTDGDPSEDDRFYFGLRCESATSAESPARGSCPTGQFVVGLAADGSLVCSDLGEASMTAFRGRCALYAGWRDACDGCTSAPTKWGRVRDGECINNAQPEDSCSTVMLDGQDVNLYGLNLDGNVDGNDKFYLGFRCQ